MSKKNGDKVAFDAAESNAAAATAVCPPPAIKPPTIKPPAKFNQRIPLTERIRAAQEAAAKTKGKQS